MNSRYLAQAALFMLLLVISFMFFAMIRQFLLVIFLAGVFSGMARPMYTKLYRLLGQRRALSASLTLLLILLVILLPLLGLLGIVASQAIKISQSVAPWVQERLNSPDLFDNLLKGLPFQQTLQTYQVEIVQKAGQIVDSVSTFMINSLSAATMSTVNFIFLFFVFLYTLFFFLLDGEKLLRTILYYLPLPGKDENRMLARFTSVTRATIKGTFVIGMIQGGLGGLAFYITGMNSVLFWATCMTVLSIIPGVGSALIWGPAALLFAVSGKWLQAAGLTAFGILIIGMVDNFLRPVLVGRDTQMHQLLIFFSTLGGLSMFGLAGFIIGPIVAALFVTIWQIYGETFQHSLPEVPEKN
ncbi:MAG: AI-2E family transporter [candidate division KSB1 bacterium]|nr:AI-2E family transporter [candidate division KSB1 bacterium]